MNLALAAGLAGTLAATVLTSLSVPPPAPFTPGPWPGEALSSPDFAPGVLRGADARRQIGGKPRRGPVRLSGRLLVDDDGEFTALGATMMWAAWGWRHDRPRLEKHLAYLAEHGFDYIRALGVVGRQPYWAGREIDWRWPDYDEVIAGLTDLAYETYGLRVQWTIFGDADHVIPGAGDRFALADRFLKMSRGREHKIMLFEIANEGWQNGFGGPDGTEQLRALTRHLTARTEIPVAITATESRTCREQQELYRGGIAGILTEHFDRDIEGPEGRWKPVRQPWELAACEGLPRVASNNEPIGPGSSVTDDDHPLRLVSAAIATYMAQIPLYVFHTDAGVWGRQHLWEMPNADAIMSGYAAMKRYLPANLAGWQRHLHTDPGHPFTAFAGDQPDAVWPEGHETGAIRVFASTAGDRFVVLPIGIRGALRLEARRPLAVDVLDILSGDVRQWRELEAGEFLELAGAEAFLLTGRVQGVQAQFRAGEATEAGGRIPAHPGKSTISNSHTSSSRTSGRR